MGFKRREAEKLLVDTGRRCSICHTPHGVQLHHIVPPEEGGTDDIDNAIPLCPNCHDEVHGSYAVRRTTRSYSTEELKLHRQRTIDLVRKAAEWAPGAPAWEEDRALILFYAQCLDRPAFHTHFHVETSFSDFDTAMEDTLVALNTGYWRTRDGAVIDRCKGKAHLVHQPWREKMEGIVAIIEEVRKRFRGAAGFNRMPYEYSSRRRYGDDRAIDEMMDGLLRSDIGLGRWMDEQRQEAIDIMNSILGEIGHQPIRGMRNW